MIPSIFHNLLVTDSKDTEVDEIPSKEFKRIIIKKDQ